MKRLLILGHRWSGVVLAFFLLLWFFSGLVIIYAGSSVPTPEAKLAAAEPLVPGERWLSAGAAWQRGRTTIPALKGDEVPVPIAARLLRRAGETDWLIEDNVGRRTLLSAKDGQPRTVSAEQALHIARRWQQGSQPRLIASFASDDDTQSSYYDSYRPFHKVALGDKAGTELVISARTGEVMRLTTSRARTLYYFGSWLHFLRPLDSIGLGKIRHDILPWLGLALCLTAVAGLALGLMNWRPGWFRNKFRPRYENGLTQPYSLRWQRWHFWLGLCTGIFVITWSFSGFISHSPWKLFSPAAASPEEVRAYRGGVLPKAALDEVPQLVLWKDVAEFQWSYLGDTAVLLAGRTNGQRMTTKLSDGDVPYSSHELEVAAQRMLPGVAVKETVKLTAYDAYYYPARYQSLLDKPLPVVQVKFDDAVGTSVYLSPMDGSVVSKLDKSRRVYRWLFAALHKWDFGWLAIRPYWDGWMILLCLSGMAFSVTSLVVAVRRVTVRKEAAE